MSRSGCLWGWVHDLLASPSIPAKRIPARPIPKPAYRRVPSLLTQAELAFYNTLRCCLNLNQDLFVKVRLADVLNVTTTRRESPSQFQTDFNRISRKHLDFVVCDIATLRPLLVIELDDRSHQRRDRIERDRFVDKACHDAGLPILHIQNSWSYNTQHLTRQIAAAISRPGM
jgi:very-short-patch-repair endonuclease